MALPQHVKLLRQTTQHVRMTQAVEGNALEGQGCTTAGPDPNLLGYLILDGALDGLFKRIQWDVEQRYVTTSQTH